MAFLEKAIPENTKKSTKYGVKMYNRKFTKMKKYFMKVNIKLKQTSKYSSVYFTN